MVDARVPFWSVTVLVMSLKFTKMVSPLTVPVDKTRPARRPWFGPNVRTISSDAPCLEMALRRARLPSVLALIAAADS